MSLSIDLSTDWQGALRLLLGSCCPQLCDVRARRLVLLSCDGVAIYSGALRSFRNPTVPEVTTCSLPSVTSGSQRAMPLCLKRHPKRQTKIEIMVILYVLRANHA